MKQRRAQSSHGRRSPIERLARGAHQSVIGSRFGLFRAIGTVDHGRTTRGVQGVRDPRTSNRSASSTAPRTRRSLNAIAVIFAVHGMISGNFATRVPSLAARLGLDAGDLGMALLSSALGAAVVIPIAGKLVARFGGRTTTLVSVIAYCLMLATPAFMPNLTALCMTLLVYGALAGICDVAMKAQGNSLEVTVGRPIMSRLFGMWSVGALAGAGVGTLATFIQLDVRLHLAWIAVVLLVLSSASAVALPRTMTSTSAPAPVARTRQFGMPRITIPSKALLGVAVIGFCASFGEAAAHTWSAVYISDVTGGSAATGSIGFGAFVASMAAGRLAGDNLVSRFGPVRTVQAAGLLAIAGGTLVVTAAIPTVGLVGFAMLGLGIAVVMPVALSAGARVAPSPGQGISAILVFAQLACTASPATIGGIGEAISLPAAFALTVAVLVPVVLMAKVLRVPAKVEAPRMAAIEAVPVVSLPARAIGRVTMAAAMAVPAHVTLNDITSELPAMSREAELAEHAADLGKAPILIPA